MIKKPIGIIDSGVIGFNILEDLSRKFKNEKLIYINDLKNSKYYNMPEDTARELIINNIKKLFLADIKLLIVASDVVYEIAEDYLNSLKIPVFDIVNILIDYTQEKFEQKNIILAAKTEILEANIYQKNFKYNRLYNIPSEELEKLILDNKLKTSESFSKTKEIFKPLINRNLDVIVASSPFLIKLETELREILEFDEITNFGELVIRKIIANFFSLNLKGRGSIVVMSNVSKQKFKDYTKWQELKYKYIDYSKK